MIRTYDEFLQLKDNDRTNALFWIVEYSEGNYNNESQHYSLLRNEILLHPQDFKDRLNNGIYRIWNEIPKETQW